MPKFTKKKLVRKKFSKKKLVRKKKKLVKKLAQRPSKFCVACSGSGRSSKGENCRPCNGLGKILQANDSIRLRTGLFYKH